MSNLKEVFKINKAIIIYTIVDDILKALGHKFDKKQKMNDSEVITTMFAAALTFPGNIEKARINLRDFGLIPDMLSKSRLNRRIHALSDVFQTLFARLADIIKQANDSNEQMSINLMVQRKKPSNRQDVYPIKLLKQFMRKRIETTFSEINQLLPKKMHAVTFTGFLLKVFAFVAAYAFNKAFCC